MPSVLSRIAELRNKFYKFAPKQSQGKIEKVFEIYKDRANLDFRTVQNMVLGLYSPSLIGKDKVEKCTRTSSVSNRTRTNTQQTGKGA